MSDAQAQDAPHPPTVAFNRASLEGRELEYVREAMEGGHTSSGGPFSKLCADLLIETVGTQDALMTTSCTAALELVALMLDLKEGDTVVVPSFTFTTSALAFARQGARLLFCDIEPETLALDPAHLATLLDDSVRAVVLVHYAGIAGDMEGIEAVLRNRPDIVLVEDNAHGLFGAYRGRPLGSIGRYASQSFHETKNFACGEGGALLLNDAADVDRARVLFDKGTNRRAFLLGAVDKYSWKDTGSSFGMADTLAAHLWGQLEQHESIQTKRRDLYEYYRAAVLPHAQDLGIVVPTIPGDREQSYHMFHVLLPTNRVRNQVLRTMGKHGVQATFHYVPLHSSDGGVKFRARETECPVTDDISGRLLRLPFHNNVPADDRERVVNVFLEATKEALATA